ncbi:hypothetical protein MLD38_000870 [Melastoma candidum]|uniref:Uncharacterized protein n=1 Tax=Melastoma candidum TaxID=119954 RepID=A0ACB9SES4_9MYRT|nr:hypothetical protein MLD38_000870 [Melastoma candidum]
MLKLLGPKDAFRMSLVCKSWRSLVSDHRLWIYFLQNQQEPWESTFFAEANLRLGFPIQAVSSQLPQLSFMNIYTQRKQVPGAVIIDGSQGRWLFFNWTGSSFLSAFCFLTPSRMINFDSLYTVRTLKEELCYVVLDSLSTFPLAWCSLKKLFQHKSRFNRIW